MKKLKRLEINTDKLMKNEELLTLRGGYSSYLCYAREVLPGFCSGFITGINTSSCSNAKILCHDVYGGECVYGGDC